MLKTSSSQEVWWVRLDSLDVPPAKRGAEHFERKRIGYRYRRYINNPQREIAFIRRFLDGDKESQEAPKSKGAKTRRSGSK